MKNVDENFTECRNYLMPDNEWYKQACVMYLRNDVKWQLPMIHKVEMVTLMLFVFEIRTHKLAEVLLKIEKTLVV